MIDRSQQPCPPDDEPAAPGDSVNDACPSAEALEHFLRTVDDGEVHGDLAAHLDTCSSCRALAERMSEHATWSDDLRWVNRLRDETAVDVNVPLDRLNELLTDYEIVEEIGRGGMGIVFAARHLRLKRQVALKVLPALLGAVRPDAIGRFEREATVLAHLQHTNIIPVFDFGQVDGTLYYTMPLIVGRSLRDILSEINETGAIDMVVDSPTESPTTTRIGSSAGTDRLYYRRVAEWMAEVADALDYAHERGVIHRDIKPSNLLLAADGRMMISDFGLARANGAATLTVSRTLLGTARYMSPEQVDEEAAGPVDRRCDVYGLGATMYEMLAMRPMFAGIDDREVLNCVLNKEPLPPHRFVPRVPRELETICIKAVDKNPAQRYATAKDLAADLRRWLLGMPILARRPSLPARAMKFVRRRRLPTALAVMLMIVLVAAGFLYAGYRTSHRQAIDVKEFAESQAVQVLKLEAQNELFRHGRYADALAKIDQALAIEPDSLKLKISRARVLRHLKRPAEAVTLLEEILQRKPDSWASHISLALAYRNLGNDEKAAYHNQQVAQMNPNTAEALYARAVEEKDPHKAVELLTKALELKPDDTTPLLINRSWRYFALKQYDAMLMDILQVAGAHPNWAFVQAQRGTALFHLGRYAEAERAYSRSIELDPDQPSAWSNRGSARIMMGRVSEALADVNEALRRDPDFALAYYMRAKAKADLGKLEEAILDCDRAIKLDSTDADFHLRRSHLFGAMGRWEESIAACTRAIQLAPDNATGYANRGVAHMEIKRYDRAVADLTRSIDLIPDKVPVYRSRASAYIFSDLFEEAVTDLTKAMTLQPGFAKDYHRRSFCLLRLGRHEEAAADITHLMTLRSHPIDRLQRGRAYELARDWTKAAADYDAVATCEGAAAEYAKLWQYLVLRQARRDRVAEEMLSSYAEKPAGEVWTDRLFDLFLGKLSSEDLLASAVTKDERAEAYYYIARKMLLDDSPDDAKDAFAKCIHLNRPNVLETDFARALLKRLENDHVEVKNSAVTGATLTP